MSRTPPKYVLIGLPTVIFTYLGFTTLTSFLEGTFKTRSLTRLTSKSEREVRVGEGEGEGEGEGGGGVAVTRCRSFFQLCVQSFSQAPLFIFRASSPSEFAF